jgi:hypothetical protein
MSARDKRIRAEATALWRELYHEDPPPRMDAAQILELMLSRLPPATRYEQLASPHLRRSAMSWPRRPAR